MRLLRLGICGRYHLLKLQHLQNKVLHTIDKFPRFTPVRQLCMTFQVLYDYIPKSCRQQTEVIQNHENANVHNIGKGEAQQQVAIVT
jgi:hypothetical protein